MRKLMILRWRRCRSQERVLGGEAYGKCLLVDDGSPPLQTVLT